MFDPRSLYAVTGDLPASYKNLSSISLDVSPYEYEAAKARYTAYELLVDAARKCVASFEVRYRAIPPDVELDPAILDEWRAEMKAVDVAAIMALRAALIPVEEAG